MPTRHITRTQAEWRARLTAEQYRVAFDRGTERAFSSPLYTEHRHGTYNCVACDTPLWSSQHKFDSGTGWPSFYQPITPNAVATRADWGLFTPRTEVHCATCGAHQGHVFDDGPRPTGKRWCINGVVLTFKPS